MRTGKEDMFNPLIILNMIQTLKRLSLVDPSNVKGERISKNTQLNILGGYGGYLTCTCYWRDLEETGLCGSTDPIQCEFWAYYKYPQTDDWFGPFIGCYNCY